MSIVSDIRVPLTRSTSWLARSAISVLGSPRSGTTWLAKIIDSHPDVLYRHEPDEVCAARPDLDPASQLAEWIAERRLPLSGPRPFFRKSWRPAPIGALRAALAGGMKRAARLPGMGGVLAQFSLPDMVSIEPHTNVRALIKLVNWSAIEAARALPESRYFFILRHPCGQVESVLRGTSERLWKVRGQGEIPDDLLDAAICASANGIDGLAFAGLPDAAKYAWAWRAFNETALEGLEALPNVKVVIHEELCAQPEAVTRDLFSFAGLTWNAQTARFLATSTNHQGPISYFSVFRNSVETVDRWRTLMAWDAQEAVRSVVLGSRLVRFWPDLG
jgi:hypothetical protein